MFPLQYFGNRIEQIDELKSLILKLRQQRNEPFKCYFDLFAGSASLTFTFLKYDNFAEKYVINDIFLPVIEFWKQVQANPRALIEKYNDLVKSYINLSANNYHERQDFFDNLQNQIVFETKDIENSTPESAAVFAFIVNHAVDGKPLISKNNGQQKLVCQLIETPGELVIDLQFAEAVSEYHCLLKDKNVEFISQPFAHFNAHDFTSDDLVILDPPYPDMPDAKQSPNNHIYQRSEPKNELKKQLKTLLKELDSRQVTFFMFYGVLGMENYHSIKWIRGHVLHLTGNEQGPFKKYVEHLYLSSNLAKLQCEISTQLTAQTALNIIQPCFHQIFETQAYQGNYKNGDRIAMVWGEQAWTYVQVNKAANRLARFLLNQGLAERLNAKQEDVIVALYLDRGPQLIISILAVMKTGAAYLPLDTNTKRLSIVAAKKRFADSNAEFLLTNYELVNDTANTLDTKQNLGLSLEHSSKQNLFLKKNKYLATNPVTRQTTAQFIIDANDCLFEKLTQAEADTNLNMLVSPQALAYIMYTSGSTGAPKGVEILQRGLPYAFESHQDLLNLGPADRIAQFASIGFDASLMEIMMALGSGAELHIAREEEYTDANQLKKFLKNKQITVAILTPKILELLDPKDFPKLRALLIVGDNFNQNLSNAWIETVVINQKSKLRKVVNGYGLTETTICTTLALCSKEKPLSIGKAILGCEINLRPLAEEMNDLAAQHISINENTAWLTASNLNPATLDTEGALYISGPCLARGYWQQSNLTQQRFKTLRNPAKTFYQTGDVGHFIQGTNKISLNGRIDRQVKIRGQRVELDEIEAQLLQLKNWIAGARVVVQEKSFTRQTDTLVKYFKTKVLAAYLVPQDQNLIMNDLSNPSESSIAALRQVQNAIMRQLPRYMCPSLTNMLWVSTLPHKDNDKKSYDDAIIKVKWPVPCFKLNNNNQLLEKLTPKEKIELNKIKHLFAEALGFDSDQLNYDDDFYELGGDSISVSWLVQQLRKLPTQDRYLKTILANLTVNTFNQYSPPTLEAFWNYIKFQKIEESQKAKAIDTQLNNRFNKTITDRDLIMEDLGILLQSKSLEIKANLKFPLPVYALHALLGDANLDYAGSELDNLPCQYTNLSVPYPFYTLKSKDFIESLINYHVNKIQSAQAAGNHYACWLVGWSAGGYLAKLVAEKLRQQNYRVFVLLLDSYHPNLTQALNSEQHYKILLSSLEKIQDTIFKVLNLSHTDKTIISTSEKELRQKNKVEQINCALAYFETFIQDKLSDAEDETKVVQVKNMVKCARLFLLSLQQTQTSSQLHPDDTLVVTKASAKIWNHATLGWQTVISNQLTNIVSADHFNLLTHQELQVILKNWFTQRMISLSINFYTGIVEFLKGNYNQAIDSLTKTLVEEPINTKALMIRAHAYIYLDDYPQALQDYKAALNIEPNLIDSIQSNVGNYIKEVPNEYLCPITKHIMSKPVRAADGIAYEKEAIEKYLNDHDESKGLIKSPVKRTSLENKILKPDTELKSGIEFFLLLYPSFVEELYTNDLSNLNLLTKKETIMENIHSSQLNPAQATPAPGEQFILADVNFLREPTQLGVANIGQLLNEEAELKQGLKELEIDDIDSLNDEIEAKQKNLARANADFEAAKTEKQREKYKVKVEKTERKLFKLERLKSLHEKIEQAKNSVSMIQLQAQLAQGLKELEIDDIDSLNDEIEAKQKNLERANEDLESAKTEKQREKYKAKVEKIERKLFKLENLKSLHGKIEQAKNSGTMIQLQAQLAEGLKEKGLNNIDDLNEEIAANQRDLERVEADLQEAKTDKLKEKYKARIEKINNNLIELEKLKEIHIKLTKPSHNFENKAVEEKSVVSSEIAVPEKDLSSSDILTIDHQTSVNPNQIIETLKIKFEKITKIPLCSQRIANELLVLAQLKKNSVDSISVSGNEISLDEKSFIERLTLLRARLETEKLYSYTLGSQLKLAEAHLQQQAWPQLLEVLEQDIFGAIEPFSILELQQVTAEGEQSANTIQENDNLVLMLGKTGVGKSTTIHFLAGSTLSKNPGENYIRPTEIINPALERIVTGEALGSSKTRFITAVPINCKDMGSKHSSKLILCDAPGFGDSAGAEVDVGNSINVLNAIQRCQSVKILILLSKKSIGDRGEGLRELVHFLANMIKNAKDYSTSFIYGFTNYDKKEYKEINDFIEKILKEELDTRYPDQNFIAVLKDIFEKTAKEVLIINPVGDKPGVFLDRLVEAEAIKFPEQKFCLSITQASQAKLIGQAKVYQEAIEPTLKRGEVELIAYYLQQLLWLKDNFAQENLGQLFEKSLNSIVDYNEELYQQALNLLDRNLADKNVMEQADVDCLAKLISEIKQWESLASNYLDTKDIFISKTLKQTAINKSKRLLEFEENLELTNLAKRLDKVKLLKNNFAELNASYDATCIELKAELDEQVTRVENHIKNREFENLGETLANLKLQHKLLKNHVNSIYCENFLKNAPEFIEQRLANCNEEISRYLVIGTELSSKMLDDIKAIFNNLEQAKNSSNLHLYVTKQKIDTIYQQLITQVKDYFNTLCQNIKAQNEINQPNLFTNVKKWVDQLNELRSIPIIEYVTATSYYSFIDNFCEKVVQASKQVTQLLESLSDTNQDFNEWLALARSLTILDKAAWIEAIRPGSYTDVKEQVKTELFYRVNWLKRRVVNLPVGLGQENNLKTISFTVERLREMDQLDHLIEGFQELREKALEECLANVTASLSNIAANYNLTNVSLNNRRMALNGLHELQQQCALNHSSILYLKEEGYSSLPKLEKAIQQQELNCKNSREDQEDKLIYLDKQLKMLEDIESTSNIKLARQAGFNEFSDLEAAISKIHNERSERIERTTQDQQNLESKLKQLHAIKEKFLQLCSETELNPIVKDLLKLKGFKSLEHLQQVMDVEKFTIIKYENLGLDSIFDRLNYQEFFQAKSYLEQCRAYRLNGNIDQLMFNLNKYGEAYADMVKHEISNSIKKLLANHDDTHQSLQILIKRLNEVKQLQNVSKDLANSLFGVESWSEWQDGLTTKCTDLRQQMENTIKDTQMGELNKLINIAKSLAVLDSFFYDFTDNFGELVQNYTANYKNSIGSAAANITIGLKNADYAQVDSELTTLNTDQTALSQKNYKDAKVQVIHHVEAQLRQVENQLNILIDISEEVDKVKQLAQDLTKLVQIQTMLAQQLGDKITTELEKCLTNAKDTLKAEMQIIFSKVQAAIDNDDFNYVLAKSRNLKNVLQLLSEYIDKDDKEKFEKQKQAIFSMAENVILRYEKMPIDQYEYIFASPREISERLRNCNEPQYVTAIGKFNQLLQRKLHEELQEIKNESHFSKQKERITKLYHLLEFLPTDIISSIKSPLDILEQQIKTMQAQYQQDIDNAIDGDNISQIRILLNRYQEQKLGEGTRKLKDAIVRRLQTKCTQIGSWFREGNRPFDYDLIQAFELATKYYLNFKEDLANYAELNLFKDICIELNSQLNHGLPHLLRVIHYDLTVAKPLGHTEANIVFDKIALIATNLVGLINNLEASGIKFQFEVSSNALTTTQFFKTSSINLYKALLPSQPNSIVFREEQVSPNGDCGFTALGVDRKVLVEKLLTLKSSSAARQALAEEIHAALLSGDLQAPDKLWQELQDKLHNLQTNLDDYFRKTRDRLQDAQAKNLPLEALIKWFNQKGYSEGKTLDNLFKQVHKAERAIQAYCAEEKVFEYYLNALRGTLWLGYQSALLYAKQVGISVYIWRKDEKSINQLQLINYYDAGLTPKNIINMLHTNSYTHFNLLLQADKQKPHGASKKILPDLESLIKFLEDEINNFIKSILTFYAQGVKNFSSVDIQKVFNGLKGCEYFFKNLRSWFNVQKQPANLMSFMPTLSATLEELPLHNEFEAEIADLVEAKITHCINEGLITTITKRSLKSRNDFYEELNSKLLAIDSIINLLNTINRNSDIYKHLFIRKQTLLLDFAKQIDIGYSSAAECLSKENLNLEDFKTLSLYLEHFASMAEQIKYFELNQDSKLEPKKSFGELRDKLLDKLTSLVAKAHACFSDQGVLAAQIIKIKYFAEQITLFRAEINNMIDDLLKAFQTHYGAHDTTAMPKLAVALEKTTGANTELAQLVLTEHKFFKGYNIALFNDAIQKHDIHYVLNHLEGATQDEQIIIDKDALEKCYQKFDKTYKQLVKNNLSAKGNDIQAVLNSLEKIVKPLRAQVPQVAANILWPAPILSELPNLMAHVFAIWTLNTAEHFFASEEAQSASESSRYLLKPHAAQVVAIFRMLGIGYKPTMSIGQSVLNAFGLSLQSGEKSSSGLINNLIEIGTGEGKSITLAVVSTVLALLGMDVNVACYSEYLSKRDFQDFEKMFTQLGVLGHIHYGTFNQLCERVVNEQGSIRERVNHLIVGDKAKAEPKPLDPRPKVLMVDEVDVFFSKDFYGQVYSPSALVKKPNIKALIDYIWAHKDNNLTLKTMKETAEYKACAIELKDYMPLVDEAIKSMLLEIKDFAKPAYVVKDDKIGYKDQDTISFNQNYGYRTLFAYYCEHAKGNITLARLEERIGLYINCGALSYADIPRNFQAIMGVSGTLKTLTNPEREVIKKDYGIALFTYMPSVFGKSNAKKFREDKDIKIVGETDFFNTLRKEIDDCMITTKNSIHRPVAVFFESQKELDVFLESSSLVDIRNNINLITEELTEREKVAAIKRATTNGQLTLATRVFGRGTDFICRDKTVEAEGGLHVIQTFLSPQIAEEKQIKGRTARQGANGSYSMVLLDAELEKFQITKDDVEHMHKKGVYYSALDKKRREFFVLQYNNDIKFVGEARKEHKATVAFIKDLNEGKLGQVKAFLLLQNKGPMETIITKSRTICLMDATGSMSNLLQQAKNQVGTMFERAATILKENSIPAEAFQLQFAVYRNYNCDDTKLLQYSPWETKPANLRNFMSSIKPAGGMGEEAIEIGLWHVNQESAQGNVTQVLLIGDAPAQNAQQVKDRYKDYGSLRNTTKFKQTTDYLTELKTIQDKKIPVNTFFIGPWPKANFEEIAKATGGTAMPLDVNSDKGADLLTDAVTKAILKNVGGDTQGEQLVQAYEAKFNKSYTA